MWFYYIQVSCIFDINNNELALIIKISGERMDQPIARTDEIEYLAFISYRHALKLTVNSITHYQDNQNPTHFSWLRFDMKREDNSISLKRVETSEITALVRTT